MAIPRRDQVCISTTPFYHCMSRCVRRAFLYGVDEYTGKDYSHRKQWIVDRIKLLAQVFCIDICAYAVMSNHYHVVLHVNTDKARKLSLAKMLERWAKVFPKDALKYQNELATYTADKRSTLRDKFYNTLTDISWFMRCLNEYVAKQANKEDELTGRFWDGRYKSQALLDEGAVLTAMAYVDLNPVRAGLADTPERSEFTSIYERIKQYQAANNSNVPSQPDDLVPFRDEGAESRLIFELEDYLELVDVTSRVQRDGKAYVPEHFDSLLERIHLSVDGWLNMTQNIENGFYYAVGHAEMLRQFAPKNIQRSRAYQSAEENYLPLM